MSTYLITDIVCATHAEGASSNIMSIASRSDRSTGVAYCRLSPLSVTAVLTISRSDRRHGSANWSAIPFLLTAVCTTSWSARRESCAYCSARASLHTADRTTSRSARRKGCANWSAVPVVSTAARTTPRFCKLEGESVVRDRSVDDGRVGTESRVQALQRDTLLLNDSSTVEECFNRLEPQNHRSVPIWW